ncbi:hypothetical protein AB0A73_04490 [Glycomyces sp. NPDC047369]
MTIASNTTDRTGPARSIAAWIAAPIAWFLAFPAWIYLGDASTAVLVVLLAIPAPWLLWTAWRMPRPRLGTYLAEGGALLTGAVALYLTVLYNMIGNDGPAPLGFTLIYLGAAAVFVAAAIPLPGRRIAYGAAALACAVIGIGLRVLSSETSYYPGIDWVTKDELFAWVFLGLPALGALLQTLRWWRRRNRAE